MDFFRNIGEVPDLSGQVEILRPQRPVFTGPYSYIYRGQILSSKQLVAIKVLVALRDTSVHTMKRKIERERQAWSALSHPNILPLYGFAHEGDLFEPFGAFISPWLQRGDAAHFLAEYGESITRNHRIDLWWDVVAGVNYLHYYNPILIHGDLKPKNVLIDDYGNAQICDFGLVRIYLDDGTTGMSTTTQYTGTERYLAYELVKTDDDPIPTIATDIHALGCIGLEFIFLTIPYSNRKNNFRGIIYEDIKKGKPPSEGLAPLESPQPDDWWDVLTQCWNLDPPKRPTSEQLLERLSIWSAGLLPSKRISWRSGSRHGSSHSRHSNTSSLFARRRRAAIVHHKGSPLVNSRNFKIGTDDQDPSGLPPRFRQPSVWDLPSRAMTPGGSGSRSRRLLHPQLSPSPGRKNISPLASQLSSPLQQAIIPASEEGLPPSPPPLLRSPLRSSIGSHESSRHLKQTMIVTSYRTGSKERMAQRKKDVKAKKSGFRRLFNKLFRGQSPDRSHTNAEKDTSKAPLKQPVPGRHRSRTPPITVMIPNGQQPAHVPPPIPQSSPNIINVNVPLTNAPSRSRSPLHRVISKQRSRTPPIIINADRSRSRSPSRRHRASRRERSHTPPVIITGSRRDRSRSPRRLASRRSRSLVQIYEGSRRSYSPRQRRSYSPRARRSLSPHQRRSYSPPRILHGGPHYGAVDLDAGTRRHRGYGPRRSHSPLTSQLSRSPEREREIHRGSRSPIRRRGSSVGPSSTYFDYFVDYNMGPCHSPGEGSCSSPEEYARGGTRQSSPRGDSRYDPEEFARGAHRGSGRGYSRYGRDEFDEDRRKSYKRREHSLRDPGDFNTGPPRTQRPDSRRLTRFTTSPLGNRLSRRPPSPEKVESSVETRASRTHHSRCSSSPITVLVRDDEDEPIIRPTTRRPGVLSTTHEGDSIRTSPSDIQVPGSRAHRSHATLRVASPGGRRPMSPTIIRLPENEISRRESPQMLRIGPSRSKSLSDIIKLPTPPQSLPRAQVLRVGTPTAVESVLVPDPRLRTPPQIFIQLSGQDHVPIRSQTIRVGGTSIPPATSMELVVQPVPSIIQLPGDAHEPYRSQTIRVGTPEQRDFATSPVNMQPAELSPSIIQLSGDGTNYIGQNVRVTLQSPPFFAESVIRLPEQPRRSPGAIMVPATQKQPISRIGSPRTVLVDESHKESRSRSPWTITVPMPSTRKGSRSPTRVGPVVQPVSPSIVRIHSQGIPAPVSTSQFVRVGGSLPQPPVTPAYVRIGGPSVVATQPSREPSPSYHPIPTTIQLPGTAPQSPMTPSYVRVGGQPIAESIQLPGNATQRPISPSYVRVGGQPITSRRRESVVLVPGRLEYLRSRRLMRAHDGDRHNRRSPSRSRSLDEMRSYSYSPRQRRSYSPSTRLHEASHYDPIEYDEGAQRHRMSSPPRHNRFLRRTNHSVSLSRGRESPSSSYMNAPSPEPSLLSSRENSPQSPQYSLRGQPRKQWTRGQLITKKPYSKVFLGFDLETSDALAIKAVEMSSSDDSSERRHAIEASRSEIEVLSHLKHPNIVGFLGNEDTPQYSYIFTEYMSGGSIAEFYHKMGHAFDEDLTRHYTKQIVDAVAYMHSNGIIHRDLNTENISVDHDGVCKISNFETAIRAKDDIYAAHQYTTLVTNLGFSTAPEMVNTSPEYGGKVDIWSIGCVVLEMYTGERPWAPKSLEEVLKLMAGEDTVQAPPLPPQVICEEGRNLLTQCFPIKPNDRPTAEELQSHAYMQESDWKFRRGILSAP